MCMFEDTCLGFMFNTTRGTKGNCQLLSITQVLFQGEQADLENDPVVSQDIAYYPVQKGCLVPNCRVSEEYVFIEEICFCIKYYPIFLAYADASNFCNQDGGELARIDNLIKQIFATQLLIKTWLVTLDVTIQGFYNIEDWYFDDETRLNFYYWSTNGKQPNLNGEEYIFLRPTENGGWHDTSDYPRPFLCEITPM
ncbi:unnamed protein product [Mytilus coruscus]|uniref:C-type lectin domain-containing protein n=1 Tax=Mytilus coruscus TaxID=42192 RepID=A0A6J8EHD5_MYTCO|nr:unnamed protein product [Mytilus coruscus]